MSNSDRKERHNKRGKTSVGLEKEVKRKMPPYVGENENKFGKFIFENKGESVNIKKTRKINANVIIIDKIIYKFI